MADKGDKASAGVPVMSAAPVRPRPSVGRSSARKAGKPTVSKARRGTWSWGRARSAAGNSARACVPKASMAQAMASLGSLAWNTPLTTRRWLCKPNSCNSCEVLAASWIAPVSGRVTSTTVVICGSLSASSAALKRSSCIFRPECGPRQDAPRSLPAKKPLQALGRLSRRRVWPVGAVSKMTWS